MNWKKVKLGDICEINMGKTPSRANPKYWGEGNNWVSIADLSSTKNECFIKNTKEQITDLAVKESGIKLVPSNTLLYSFKLSIGKVAITQTPLFTNEAIVALPIKDKNELNVKYLYHAIQRVNLDGVGDKAVMGITLNKEKLKVLEIPLPDLATQKHIAEVLDKADALRQQNRQLLAHYDELLQSTFIELFGDPVKNPKGWEVKKLGEVAKAERGRFSPRPRNDPSYFDGIYPFIQTGDISSSNHRLTKWQQTLNEKGTKVSKRFDKGTIVVAIVGATIGASAILEIVTYAPDSVIGITVNNKFLNNYFLEYVLRYWKPIFLAQAPATARANINLETFKPLPIPVPPLPLQQHFAKIVEQIEAQKAQTQTALAESEALFEGLLAGYFK